ncbi:hypothetical protein [Flavobacterium sp. ZB4P13]|uniref:hypothetical protein n=1 Tax=Flavobacterium sp. ZB4P13 TaxID=3401728 RepID=UPI003AACDA12
MQAAVHKMIPSFSIMGISADYENMAKKIQKYPTTQQEVDEISGLVIQLEEVLNQVCRELEIEYAILKNNEK